MNIRGQSFVADLPAREAFLNIKQFNGYFGCLNCFHPGEYDQEVSKVIFRPLENVPLKTTDLYNQLSAMAEFKNEDQFGFKGTTSLSKLFRIPEQIPYDYMHLVLQGHCKWLLQKIFKSKSSPIFISDFEALEQSLLKVKVPHFMNRKPRSLKEINKWKSAEIKLFSFYLAVPLLIDSIPSLYFCHFACYIFAMRTLYEPINKQNLKSIEELIKKYVDFIGKYYGNGAYDFTIHAHLHLVKQVEQHGPLKSHSQFVFEVLLNFCFVNYLFYNIFKN